MKCPECGSATTVYDTRMDGHMVYRRRKCLANKYHRFETVEEPTAIHVKFDRHKKKKA